MDSNMSQLPLSLAPPSAADVIATLPDWTDLIPDARDSLARSITEACRICGASPADTLMNCSWLNQRLFARAPGASGLTTKRFAAIVSDLRYILCRLERLDTYERGKVGLSAEWIRLWNMIPNRNVRATLSAFMHYASRCGIEPTHVQPDMLVEFEDWLTANTLGRSIPHTVRVTKYAWRDMRILLPDWPAVDLLRPSRRVCYGVKLSELPAPFQADIASFRARLSQGFHGTLFRRVETFETSSGRRRRRKPARPRTIETRESQILMAASALLQSGFPIASFRSLRDLVEPLDHADAIVSFFWKKSGEVAGAHVAGITEVLRQIALYHCQPASPSAASIVEWAAEVTPRQDDGMTEKNRRRLQAMTQSPTLGRILEMPVVLMQEALEEPPSRSQRGAVMAMRATMIELLLHCPMRRDSLRLLRLDEHFLRLGEANAITHIWAPGTLTKTGQPLEWPIAPECAEFLELWITRFRPFLCDPGNPFLFGGRGEQPKSRGGLSTTITTIFAQRAGVEMHVHLMRHFAAWIYLRNHPGDYGMVSQMLGHSSEATTKKFYASLNIDSAARHWAKTLLNERRVTQEQAQAALWQSPGMRRNGEVLPNGWR